MVGVAMRHQDQVDLAERVELAEASLRRGPDTGRDA